MLSEIYMRECARGTLTPSKAQPTQSVCEDHLHADSHMFPGAKVVSSPHSAKALRTSEERACQHKGTLGDLAALDEAAGGDVGLKRDDQSMAGLGHM